MIKNLLIIICMWLPCISFGQSRPLVDSINKVIGPGYELSVDSMMMKYYMYNSINEIDLTGDGKKEIVIAAAKASTEKGSDTNKIFVLERKDNRLGILDSSADYDVDGRGPTIQVNGRNLIVNHSFHHGYGTITYSFNKTVNSYRLTALEYFEVETNYPDTLHTLNYGQVFNVERQILTLHSSINRHADDSIDKEKTKRVPYKLPAGVSLLLSDMKDPLGYDIFLTKGPIYEAVMKY